MINKIKIISFSIFLSTLYMYGKDNFSIGGLTSFNNKQAGGGIEIGFPLIKTQNFVMRNYISLFGYGINYNNSGSILLQDKITFGDNRDSNIVRLYGFISGGFGVFKQDNKNFFQAPFAWECFVGGGADINASENASIFIETGGGVSANGNVNINTFARIQVGFRGFF